MRDCSPPPLDVSAHCDLPCGVYDPAQARIEAESVKAHHREGRRQRRPRLPHPRDPDQGAALRAVKHHLWVLWTDYFKPPHFEKYPQLHTLVNEATKLAGASGTKGVLDADKCRRAARQDRRDRRDLLGDQEGLTRATPVGAGHHRRHRTPRRPAPTSLAADAPFTTDGTCRDRARTRPAGPAPDVELRLPADSAYVSVLRTTTAGLAARLDFTVDDIEDLRIAVDEACAMVLPQADPDARPDRARFDLAPGDARPSRSASRTSTSPRPPTTTASPGRCSPRSTTRSPPTLRRRSAHADHGPGTGAGSDARVHGALAGGVAEHRGHGDLRRAMRASERRAVRDARATDGATEAERSDVPRRAGAPAPAARRALRAAVPQPRRAVRRPRPGRHDRADQVRRPLRHRPRRGVLDVRHADHRRRDQAALPRQGLGDPGAAPAPGAADVDRVGATAELTQTLGRSPTPRELAESIGVSVEEIIEGIESSNAYSTLSLDAPRRQRRRRRRDARRDRRRRRRRSSTSRSASPSSRCSRRSTRARSRSCCCGSSRT